MTDTLILSEQLPTVRNTEIAALRSVVQDLVAENQRLRQHMASMTTANAAAAALTVELREAQALLQMQNAQLELHNRFIRHTFGRYLNNDVVARLLDSPTGLALGGGKTQGDPADVRLARLYYPLGTHTPRGGCHHSQPLSRRYGRYYPAVS